MGCGQVNQAKLDADVTVSESDRGDVFTGCAELAVGHIRRLRSQDGAWTWRPTSWQLQERRRGCTLAQGGCRLQKFSALHAFLFCRATSGFDDGSHGDCRSRSHHKFTSLLSVSTLKLPLDQSKPSSTDKTAITVSPIY
jgi:hypothetical protein